MSQYQIARIKIRGKKFEILVDPELAWEVRKGQKISIDRLLAYPEIYRDARKGERASSEELVEVFGTDDLEKVVYKIIMEGEVPLTTEQRRKLIEEKRKKIIALIASRAVDPRTKLPIPQKRIELALEQAKVRIDPFKSAEEQLPEVLKALRTILPISLESKKVEVIIPAVYAAKAYSIVKKYNPAKEEWLGDGSLKAILEVPAGMVDKLLSELGSLTKGEFKSRILEG